MTKRRLRRDGPPPERRTEVLRGHRLDADQLREDATFNHAVYGFYGISVWLPTPQFSWEAILATTLRAAQEVTVLTAGDLYDRGLRLWDTGQEPHYDVVYVESGDLDALITGLLAATHVVRDNEHYDPEGE
jgi:hypothetical protein